MKLLLPIFVTALVGVSRLAVTALTPPPQSGKTSGLGDLTNMDLSDLMKVKVTTASKRPQTLMNVPAAMTVITQRDIKNSGARSIPDLLRMVPGMQVAQATSSSWGVTARGFNSYLANKMLVMIDGRSVYTPLYSGTYWEAQGLVLADIERIEVIRGPGGSLWGANAVNGIINIITKSANKTVGGYANGAVGSLTEGDGSLRYGWKVPNGAARAYVKVQQNGTFETANGQSNNDSWGSRIAGFRADFGSGSKQSITLEGQASNQLRSLPSALPSLFPPYRVYEQFTDPENQYYFQGRLSHQDSSSRSTSAQFYFDHYNREVPEIVERRDTFDLDVQQQLSLPRQHLVYGVGYRQSADSTSGSQYATFVPPGLTLHFLSGFVQDEWKLGAKAALTMGVKAERNDYTGWEFQPSVRVTERPNQRTTYWAAVSRAVRTPSREEEAFQGFVSGEPGPGGSTIQILAMGGPTLSEKLVAYEAGVRRQVNRRWFVDADAYYNDYQDLSSYLPAGAPYLSNVPFPHLVVPIVHGNGVKAQTAGFELTSRWKATDRMDVTLNYSLQAFHSRLAPGASTDGSTDSATAPRNQFGLMVHDVLGKKLSLNSSLFYNDPIPDEAVPTEYLMNANLVYKPMANWRMQLSVNNALYPRHYEAVGQGFDRYGYMPRNITFDVSYRF